MTNMLIAPVLGLRRSALLVGLLSQRFLLGFKKQNPFCMGTRKVALVQMPPTPLLQGYLNSLPSSDIGTMKFATNNCSSIGLPDSRIKGLKGNKLDTMLLPSLVFSALLSVTKGVDQWKFVFYFGLHLRTRGSYFTRCSLLCASSLWSQ